MSTESKRYRYFTKETADRYGITGWVRNCFSGDVEIEAQGRQELLQQFIKELKKGPPMGYVNDIQTKEIEVEKEGKQFSVRF